MYPVARKYSSLYRRGVITLEQVLGQAGFVSGSASRNSESLYLVYYLYRVARKYSSLHWRGVITGLG